VGRIGQETHAGRDDYRSIAPVYDLATAWALVLLRREIARLVLESARSAESARPNSLRVLDLAGGTGALARMLGRRGVSALTLDLSPAMLARAKRRGLAGSLVLADGGRLPVRSASLDCVCLVLALHENPGDIQDAMLREALRALRPDGRLVLADWLVPRGPAAHVAYVAHWLAHPVERAAGKAHYRGFREFLRAGGLEGVIARHGLMVEHLGRHFLGTLGLAAARRV